MKKSFIFGLSTPHATYDDLKKARAIADSFGGPSGVPRTTGEGIYALLSGIGKGIANRRVSRFENDLNTQSSGILNDFLGGGSTPAQSGSNETARALSGAGPSNIDRSEASGSEQGGRRNLLSSILGGFESPSGGTSPLATVAEPSPIHDALGFTPGSRPIQRGAEAGLSPNPRPIQNPDRNETAAPSPQGPVPIQTNGASEKPAAIQSAFRPDLESVDDNALAFARNTAAFETGTSDLLAASSQIFTDTGGSRSYGALGLNSGFGKSAGGGSVGEFASANPEFGLTARPGSPEFDNQWREAAEKYGQAFVAAQVRNLSGTVGPRAQTSLSEVGGDRFAGDPRVQSFITDATVQYGPSIVKKHFRAGAQGNSPEEFIELAAQSMRDNLQGDFRTYLSGVGRGNERGLLNRIDKRVRSSLEFGQTDTADGGQSQQPIIAQLPPSSDTQPTSFTAQLLQGSRDLATSEASSGGFDAQPNEVSRALTGELVAAPHVEATPTATQQPAHQGRQITQEALVKFLTDPRVSDSDTQVGLQVYKEQQQQNDPLRLQQIEAARLGNQKLRRDLDRPEERSILKGADGFSYYTDTGERVLPDVEVGPDFKTQQDLRKEYDGINTVKSFRDQTQAYQRVLSSAHEPSAAGDMALIFNFMKVLDPSSVVRESEFATAAAAGSFGQRIQSSVNQVLSGQRLSNQQRRDFVNRAGKLYSGAAEIHGLTNRRFSNFAEQQGFEAGNVVFEAAPIGVLDPDFDLNTFLPNEPNVPAASNRNQSAELSQLHQNAREAARAAIASDPAQRAAILEKLRQRNIDVTGL
ncbi:MAG: hypothetical protein AAGE61_00895 [Pseudomonadota bacterium]